MKSKSFILSVLFLLTVSCQKQLIERIEFVKDGVPNDLEIREMRTEDGYLQADEWFYLKAGKAVYGDKISLRMRMSIDDSKGHILIIAGDNTFGLSSEIYYDRQDEPDEKIFFLMGPSIGKNIVLGEMSDFIKPNVPFDLSINYENRKLIYSIDGSEIYSGKTIIPPAGLISMQEYGNLRVYDLVCEGYFKPVDLFYTKEFLLERAHKSVAKVAEQVKGDPNRPAYHFQPPANWNNDPNGMLFYKGYYHMFYQHNPYADRWDWMHWGHARSVDLIYWEHMPIALWPSVELGENHCFSGSGFIKDDGKPILFYTSIGHEHPEHWAAIPIDDELFDWEKHPANPIVVMEDHGEQIIDDWRDPFLFREAGNTYMVIGGHPRGGKGSIMMYKALNTELTDWEYLGSPFEGEEGNWECPNFFKVGNKYVLIYSPNGTVKYLTGTLDVQNVRFMPEYHGAVDDGVNYYAPNTLQKDDGRRILFGWIPDFKPGQGWQGAISLPRELSIDKNGRLVQKPVLELTELRGEMTSETNVTVSGIPKKVPVDFPQFEMILRIADEGADRIGFRFNDEKGDPYDIVITPDMISYGDEKNLLDPGLSEKIREIQFFFDRTIIEIFVNGGLLCATRVVYPDKENFYFEIVADKDAFNLELINLWDMTSIWR